MLVWGGPAPEGTQVADGLPDRAMLPDAAMLPDQAICLHIGVHKTGTTALQAALADARKDLAAHHVTYPGRRLAHHGPAMAVLGRPWGWSGRGGQSTDPAVFDALARQVRRQRGRVMISSEQFCEADDAAAARVVDGLGAQRTHVVIGLRNLGRLLPSSWQQYLKYGQTMPYQRWLTKMFDPAGPGRTTPTFWRRNDHAALVRRWADLVGPDHVVVLVLDDVAPSAQFVAFAQLLGLPEQVLLQRADLAPNRSMTAAEAEVLRRLNVAVKSGLGWPQYESLVRDGLARALLERVPGADEPRLHTPGWALDAAAERGAATTAAIRDTGVRVIGDLDRLDRRLPEGPQVPAAVLDTLATDDVVAVLATSILAAGAAPPSSSRTRDLAARARRGAARRIPGLS